MELPETGQIVYGVLSSGAIKDPVSLISMDKARSGTIPIPPTLLARACDQIGHKYAPLPFVRDGLEVPKHLIAAAMEELNAEVSRTLALVARTARDGRILVDGLDRRLALRGFSGEGTSRTLTAVLIESGIGIRASVMDRRSRRFLRAVRLEPGWTWTILTGEEAPPSTTMPAVGDDGGVWTSLCPICRAGRLATVTGQELFGVPATDFLACPSCGARFVPDDEKFRLVAILRRRDPLWADLLNRALSANEWKAIARSGALPGNRDKGLSSGGAGVREPHHSHPLYQQSTRFPLEIGEQTVYFTPLPLDIMRRKIRDLFRGRPDKVRDILGLPAFCHLKEPAEERYRPYLDIPVGVFLAELKDRKDAFYRRFLNPFGDLSFCMLKAKKTPLGARRGIYIVVAGSAVQAAGSSFCPFRETVDTCLGRITPSSCYLDGDPERCRINAMICRENDPGILFVHTIDDGKEISKIGLQLDSRFAGQG